MQSKFGFEDIVTFKSASVLPWLVVAITFRKDSMPCYSISHGSDNYTAYESELIFWSERQTMGFQ